MATTPLNSTRVLIPFQVGGNWVIDTTNPTGQMDQDWVEGQPPVVNSYSGTFVDGNTITLTGNNFSKLGSPFYTDFSNGTVGQRASGFYYWAAAGAEYLVTNETSSFGTKILRANPVQEDFKPTHYELPTGKNQIFLESFCRVNAIDFTSSPDAPQIKLFRVVPDTGEATMQATVTGINLIYESDGSLVCEDRPSFGGSVGWYGTMPTNNTWAKYVLYKRIGDADQSNGERYAKVGTEDSFTFSGSTVPPGSGGHMASPNATVLPSAYFGQQIITNTTATNGNPLRRVALPYFQRTQQTSIVDIAYFYVSDSRERIVIGDAPTWSACTLANVHVCEEVSRNYNQIQFKAKQGVFTSGALYAYVFNHDGLYNTNGLQVRA